MIRLQTLHINRILMAENVSDKSSGAPPVTTDGDKTGEKVDDATYQQMLDILADLTDHTHIFFDDFNTACNCNCNCTCCIRGMVW